MTIDRAGKIDPGGERFGADADREEFFLEQFLDPAAILWQHPQHDGPPPLA